MGGLDDVPAILTGWPTAISGIAVGALLFLALRLTFGARKIAADADERTARARADADAAEAALDDEREKRRRIEDQLTERIRGLSDEIAALRRQVDDLAAQLKGRG